MSWYGEMRQDHVLSQFTPQDELELGGDRIFSCHVCGALVAYERTELHFEWHEPNEAEQ